jgi:nucleoid-associated protein YgaU
MNVATSTKKFLGALGPLSSWQMKTNWKGCQDVQRSAFSDGRNYQANDAYKTGTTVALLVALNQGSYPSLAHNPGVIEIGWKPRLTGAAQAAPKTPANPPQRVYVVQSGDNLAAIARLYDDRNITWQSIAQANHLAHPDLIHTGERLAIA